MNAVEIIKRCRYCYCAIRLGYSVAEVLASVSQQTAENALSAILAAASIESKRIMNDSKAEGLACRNDEPVEYS